MAQTFKNMPKWQNLAKSSETGSSDFRGCVVNTAAAFFEWKFAYNDKNSRKSYFPTHQTYLDCDCVIWAVVVAYPLGRAASFWTRAHMYGFESGRRQLYRNSCNEITKKNEKKRPSGKGTFKIKILWCYSVQSLLSLNWRQLSECIKSFIKSSPNGI